MAYQPPNAYYSQGHPIYLYTAPLEYQKHVFNFTKPRDAIGHWAVCVQGQCYELAKNRDNDKKKKDPKYKVNWLPEDVWKAGRQPCKKSDPIGYTERPWPPQTIQYICKYAQVTSSLPLLTQMGQVVKSGDGRCKANTCTTRTTAKSSCGCSST